MQLYARYLFREFSLSTLYLSLGLIGAIWLTQSLRYIDFVMARGLSIGSFFKLILFLLPNLMAVVLPFSFFLSLLFVLNRFYNDRELIILQASGLSNYALCKPVIILAVLVCSIVYTLNLYIYPLSNQHYRALKNEILNTLTGATLQPGEFTTFKNMTFYIKAKNHHGRLRGLFVYDRRNPLHPVTIVAEKAQIIEGQQSLKLMLLNGTHQEIGRNQQPNLVSFKSYILELQNSNDTTDYDSKPGEYFLNELFKPAPNIPSKMQDKFRIEAHQRLIFPLIVFPLALWALVIFLNGEFSRRGRYKKIMVSLLGATIFESAIIIGINLGRRYFIAVNIVYCFIAISTIVLTFILLNKKINKNVKSHV